MNSVKETIDTLIAEQDYFKAVIYSDDVEQYAMQIDDVKELPAIGVFFNNQVKQDWQGAPVAACTFTFFHKLDILNKPEDSGVDTMARFTDAVNEFLGMLTPYAHRRPSSGTQFRDSVIIGVSYEIDLILLKKCESPTPPTPPGRFYDYLTADNGRDNYNIFLFNNLFVFEGLTLEFRYWCDNNAQNYAYALRYSAGVRYPNSSIPDSTVYDARYENIGRVTPVTFTDVATGEVVAETTTNANYGTTSLYTGYIALWFMRTQNNTNTQRIYHVKIWRGEVLLHDYRPYVTGDGVVGLKDVITGDFQAPQVNVSIVAIDEA